MENAWNVPLNLDRVIDIISVVALSKDKMPLLCFFQATLMLCVCYLGWNLNC